MQFDDFIFVDGWNSARFSVVFAALGLSVLWGLVGAVLKQPVVPALWVVIDGVFGSVGDRLNRAHRKLADLIFRGFLYWGLATVLILCAVSAFHWAVLRLPFYSIFMVESLILSLMVSSFSSCWLLFRLPKVMEDAHASNGAFYVLARSCRLNFSASDNYTICRAAIMLGVRLFVLGLVLPLASYLAGGIYGALIVGLFSAFSWRFRGEKSQAGFTVVSRCGERITGFIPDLLSALLIRAASIFTPQAKLLGVRAHGGKGSATACSLRQTASVLGVSLGGVFSHIDGGTLKIDWIGAEKASAKVDSHFLRRSAYLIFIAKLLFILLILLGYKTVL